MLPRTENPPEPASELGDKQKQEAILPLGWRDKGRRAVAKTRDLRTRLEPVEFG